MGSNLPIAVIGGGNGAFAAAVDLSLKGFKVNLCDPYKDGKNLKVIMTEGKVDYLGVLGQGSVALNCITSQVAEAVANTDIIIICVPATAHETIAKWLAPVLSPRATVLLNPGHTGGALHFLHILQKEAPGSNILLGETNTLSYIARKKGQHSVNITGLNRVHISALPTTQLDSLMERISPCYPDTQPTKTVLGTSLRNLNAMMHPPGMILGAAWIEHTMGDFTFYFDAATQSVARLMQAIDNERLAIAAKWGEPVEPLIDLLVSADITTREAGESGSLQRAFKESEPNRKIKAPPSLDHRYMHEDFAHGLVPMAALGSIVDVDTPVMQSLIRVGSVINETDYLSEGLNIDRLGLTGLLPKEVHSFIEEGV